MKLISPYLLVLLNNSSPALAFPIQNFLWATSNTDEAYKERAQKPVREQHVSQNQSGRGRQQTQETCQQSSFFIFALYSGFCLLTKVDWFDYLLTLPVVKFMLMVLSGGWVFLF